MFKYFPMGFLSEYWGFNLKYKDTCDAFLVFRDGYIESYYQIHLNTTNC